MAEKPTFEEIEAALQGGAIKDALKDKPLLGALFSMMPESMKRTIFGLALESQDVAREAVALGLSQSDFQKVLNQAMQEVMGRPGGDAAKLKARMRELIRNRVQEIRALE